MDDVDKGLGVQFYLLPQRDNRASAEAGRPIYADREMVRMVFPGDNKRELVAPAHEIHFNGNTRAQMTYAERFPLVYAAFKASNAVVLNGTRLSEVPFLTRADVAALEEMGIMTVEQLAEPTAEQVANLGTWADEVTGKAKSYLLAATNTQEVDNMRRELAALKAKKAA